FSGFQAVGGELDAIAGFFEHAAHELADADGIVGDQHDLVVADRVGRFARNGARGHRRSARREDARDPCRRRAERAALGGGRIHQPVQVNQQDEAAVGSNGGAGEELDAAQVGAQALDYDFVLAQHLFHDDANLAIRHAHEHQAEIAVHGFERRQLQLAVQAHDFGDQVAHARVQLSSHFFDFFRLDAPDFLDGGERESEHGGGAAHEQRLGDDQRQRDLQHEEGAGAALRAHFDLAVQRGDVGAHHVEAHAATREFGLAVGRREARVEQDIAQVAFGQFVCHFLRNQANLDGVLAHALVINAAAVVFDFDEDVVAAVVGAQDHPPALRFSGGLPFGRVFNPVRHGVADQVHQRVVNQLDDVVVQFCRFAFQIEV